MGLAAQVLYTVLMKHKLKHPSNYHEALIATSLEDPIETPTETLSIKPTNAFNYPVHTTSTEPFQINYDNLSHIPFPDMLPIHIQDFGHHPNNEYYSKTIPVPEPMSSVL
jgi:hypothetical protein